MAGRKLAQYKGGMTSAQIAAGMNAATANATRLLGDAKLLLKQKRYPGAVALAILSIEESGKVSILRELALARDQSELSDRWREYRTHIKKNVLWPFLERAMQGASKLEDFRELVHPDAEHPFVLDHLKQLSIYTDCLGSGHWSVPEKIIDEELCKQLVFAAEGLASDRKITTEEIELWIEHMQPAYGRGYEAMKEALIAWDSAMRARGLLPQDGSTMEDFIKEGIQLQPKKGTIKNTYSKNLRGRARATE
jgi:AbiV family abortive infection protein